MVACAGAWRSPKIGSKTALLVSLLVLGLFGYAAHSQVRFQQLSKELDADIATFRRQIWERPVLRGPARDQNAAEVAKSALTAFERLDDAQRDGIAQQLYYAQDLPPELKKLALEGRESIENWLASTHNAWAMNELALEMGADMEVPDYPKVIDAALLTLAVASIESPGECLRLSADLIRAGQDLVPGGPLEAASVAARMISIANPVIARCASQAEEKELRRAVREFQLLAKNPPPTGVALEMADILTAVEVREATTLQPRRRGASVVARLRERADLFDVWAFYDNPTRWRSLTPDRYPGSLEKWRKEHEWRSQSRLPGVPSATSGNLGWLYDDMRGQALLRALTVGMSTLAERMRRGKLPAEPTRLRSKSLYDPFVGRPMNWQIAKDGSEITIWSVGENLKNDMATDKWAPETPLDSVVRMKVYPLKRGDRR